MTKRSQNGYAAGTAASINVKTFAVPGYPNVHLPVRADVAPLLLSMARWFFDNVEKPVIPGCWGYAYRPIRGRTSGLSNHASGTAIDLNAPKHPLGKVGTVPQSMRAKITAAAHARGLRWGGEYTGRKDEMHFEVNVNWATAMKLVAAIQKRPVRNPSSPPANPTRPASRRPVIRRGSSGQAVKDLQNKLKKVYPAYAGRLVVDGIFGPATDAAVREFQRRSYLIVDGIVGANTWKALKL